MNLTEKNGFKWCSKCGTARPEAALKDGLCVDGWCARLEAQPAVVFRERMAEALGEPGNPDSVDLVELARSYVQRAAQALAQVMVLTAQVEVLEQQVGEFKGRAERAEAALDHTVGWRRMKL